MLGLVFLNPTPGPVPGRYKGLGFLDASVQELMHDGSILFTSGHLLSLFFFYKPSVSKEKRSLHTFCISFFPALSPVIFFFWVFRRKFWFLNGVWVWSCDVTRDWRLSLFLLCEGEESVVYWIWVTKECFSVEGNNLVFMKMH